MSEKVNLRKQKSDICLRKNNEKIIGHEEPESSITCDDCPVKYSCSATDICDYHKDCIDCPYYDCCEDSSKREVGDDDCDCSTCPYENCCKYHRKDYDEEENINEEKVTTEDTSILIGIKCIMEVIFVIAGLLFALSLLIPSVNERILGSKEPNEIAERKDVLPIKELLTGEVTDQDTMPLGEKMEALRAEALEYASRGKDYFEVNIPDSISTYSGVNDRRVEYLTYEERRDKGIEAVKDFATYGKHTVTFLEQLAVEDGNLFGDARLVINEESKVQVAPVAFPPGASLYETEYLEISNPCVLSVWDNEKFYLKLLLPKTFEGKLNFPA